MNLRCKPAFKLAALFLVFSIGQLYVFGGPNGYVNPSSQEPIGSRVGNLNGKLIIEDDETVLLNGNKVATGTTILSGAQIDTPEKVAATVMLPSGSVRVSPSSSLTVSFSGDSVRVNLAKGCTSIFLTDPNVRGEVITNQTLAWHSDPSKSNSASVCLDQNGHVNVVQGETRENVSEDVQVCGEQNFEIAAAGRRFPAGLLLFAAGSVIFGTILLTHGHANPSPITPTV